MRLFVFAALVTAGCSASFNDKNNATNGTTGDGPGSGNSGNSGNGSSGDGDGSGDGGSGGAGSDTVDDLEDLKSDIDASATGCQDIDGVSHPGAASYFYGELEPTELGEDGQRWQGTEEWILYSNDAWQDTGVADCIVTWSIQAEEVASGACGGCDYSIAVDATVDLARTSCPNGLWETDANYSVAYDIRLESDGTSTWFFGASGNSMGTGSHEGLAMNYLTTRTCVWF